MQTGYNLSTFTKNQLLKNIYTGDLCKIQDDGSSGITKVLDLSTGFIRSYNSHNNAHFIAADSNQLNFQF